MAAPTAVANASNLDLGSFLKIYQTNGIYNNLPTQSNLWKYFLKQRARDAQGKNLTYLVRTSFGPAAAQSMGISEGDYPVAQRSGVSEATANYKDFGLTVSVPKSLIGKTGNDLVQYADPLTEELDAKAIAMARVMSAQMVGDGTGVIGILASDPTIDTTADTATWTLSVTSANSGRSHIGWFMEDDKLKVATSSGTDVVKTNNNGSTVAYWKVSSIDEDNNQVTMKAYDSSDALIDLTTATVHADDPQSGDYIFRLNTTTNDLSAISTTDYDSISECMVGLESLGAADGRVVHNLTLSGALAGSQLDASGAAIDSSHFQKGLSKAKRRGGRGRYKYKNAYMYDTVYDALVESRETDRRFQSVEDGKRGVKMLGYQHGQDFVEFLADEFIPKQRIWILPESKEVLEMHGKDFQVVEPNPGQKFHLATASSGRGHSRTVLSYSEGSAVVICKHPAAILNIRNFTV